MQLLAVNTVCLQTIAFCFYSHFTQCHNLWLYNNYNNYN